MQKREIPWDKMRQEYIFTTATVRSLAEKYACSRRAVDRRSVLEGWVELRRQEMTDIGQQARARIRDQAVADHIRIYDTTRAAMDKMVAVIMKFSEDADGLFKHVVQYEHTQQDGVQKTRETVKETQVQVFSILNGKNFADIARGLRDITGLARALDGIMDARDRANLDLQRDRLDLDKKARGMDDDTAAESGIAYMPVRDMSLLDGALPDPGEAMAG